MSKKSSACTALFDFMVCFIACQYQLYIPLNIDNQVDGKMFMKLTRSDLMDLYPSDFSARKKFWDFLSELVSFQFVLIKFLHAN